MISCTEFIPAYSELFSFLDDRYGRDEVSRLWDFLFKPDGKGIPLINFVKKEGIRGCFSYWSGTLTEEASDCDLYLNEKAGWYLSTMHHCPSKGRLLELKDELFKLRFQQAINQLENPTRISAVKKDIARIKTVQRDIELHGTKA